MEPRGNRSRVEATSPSAVQNALACIREIGDPERTCQAIVELVPELESEFSKALVKMNELRLAAQGLALLRDPQKPHFVRVEKVETQ